MPSVLTFSEVGDHASNEDAFIVQPHPLDPELVVCFVADGQGGRDGGGPAAQIACRVGLEAAARVVPERLLEPRAWPTVLRQADEAVRTDEVAGFTTLIGLCVSAGKVVGASSGDSAVMLVTDAGPVELSRGQQKNPPVGSGMAVAVPFEAGLAGSWRLLVMTDGVWKYVGWKRVVEAARQTHGAELIAQLEQAARLPGSGQFPDDFTVVLVEPKTGTQHS